MKKNHVDPCWILRLKSLFVRQGGGLIVPDDYGRQGKSLSKTIVPGLRRFLLLSGFTIFDRYRTEDLQQGICGMSKETNPEGSFDLDRLKKLLQMMEKYGVTEVNLQRESEQWKVRRGPKDVPMMTHLQPMMAGQMPMMAPAPAPTAGSEAAAAPAADKGSTIDSPTVGTFYASPTPEDPPFVQIGSTVTPDKIVCIVEAMKVFNQIPAEVSGRIVEVLVKNGDPVEFGQPLFRIDPA